MLPTITELHQMERLAARHVHHLENQRQVLNTYPVVIFQRVLIQIPLVNMPWNAIVHMMAEMIAVPAAAVHRPKTICVA